MKNNRFHTDNTHFEQLCGDFTFNMSSITFLAYLHNNHLPLKLTKITMFRLKNNHQPLKLTKITIIYHKIADIEENLGLLGLNLSEILRIMP